jgi:hypothetical protein
MTRCPVCLGSGSVEAKPSVKDAVADAETLRVIARERKRDDSGGFTWASRAAASVRKLRHFVYYGHQGNGTPTEVEASNAARAAFHAVPGLRS